MGEGPPDKVCGIRAVREGSQEKVRGRRAIGEGLSEKVHRRRSTGELGNCVPTKSEEGLASEVY